MRRQKRRRKMKYAENNRISHRQLYRQILLTFLAPFLLCLNGKGGLLGLSGAVGIILAVIFLLLYSFFYLRSTYGYADMLRSFGKVRAVIFGDFFLIYLVMAGAYLLNLIGRIIPVWLIFGISEKWLLLFAVSVCACGMEKGLQKRGRMAEVTGGSFLGAILLLLILCAGQGKAEYITELFREEAFSVQTSIRSAYRYLCFFSGISLLPFVMKDVEKRGSAGKTVIGGILTVSGIMICVLVLLPAVLGWRRVQSETWPVLSLLAGADLPGNVLARFDVLWMGFLLYGLLFTIGSVFYYGERILTSAHIGTGKYWLPVAVYAAAIIEIDGVTVADLFEIYLAKIFVPGLLLILIYLFLRSRQKQIKKVATFGCIFLALVLICSGCAGIEPEKRMYPLALGIDVSGNDFVISYGMPDLPEATGQGKEEENTDRSVLTLRGRDFDEIQQLYDRSQNRYLDIGHLEVIIMGNEMLESGRWEMFLNYLKAEPLAGEDIYLFRTGDPEAVLKWDSGGASIGDYLTGLLENRVPAQQKEGVTLRQVYHQWYQGGTLLSLPKITLVDGELEVFLE